MEDFEKLEQNLINFLKNEVKKTGFSKVVLGISGGIDSAVVAVLAKKAFGNNLLGVFMPTKHSSKSSLDDAKELCEKFDISYEIKSIQKPLEAFIEDEKDISKLRVGNISARLRMITLYDISARDKRIVLGTSNKTETYLGYGTLFGDTAWAINPIGDIYKTDIFKFAKYLGVPQSIISKPPSADLWEGQSDEDELGFKYKDLDSVLKDYIDNNLPEKELLKKYDEKLVNFVINKVKQNEFKRKPPVVFKLGENK